MKVMEVLTLLTGVVDSVNRAVELLEAGERSRGMSNLEHCIGRLERTLQSWEQCDNDAAGDDDVQDLRVMRTELDSVLDDLRAARDILLAKTAEQQD